MTFSPHDYGRQKIDFGMIDADLGPRLEPSVERVLRGLEAPSLRAQRALDVLSSWPEHWAPVPRALAREPETSDALPRADYLVVTWTIAELEALADVLTPGVLRNGWYRYTRRFNDHYLPLIRTGAPARNARRLGSYYMTRVGDARVLCFKSELHLNQDGIMQASGYATLPVRDLFLQLIEEVQPRMVITVGTAGAVNPDHFLGDVYITRAAKFRCLPRAANSFAARAPLAVLPQAPDTLTVLEDEPLWAALESIEHFKSVIDVASLRKLYA